MNKLQQKTGNVVRKCIIDTLERAAGDDEFIDHIQEVCEEAGKIDTTGLEEDVLVNDPKIKKAFLKFVKSCIGSFQQMEDEFGDEGHDD